jgi:hypothetical protein
MRFERNRLKVCGGGMSGSASRMLESVQAANISEIFY